MLSSQPNGWARSRHVEAHPREPVIPAVGFHVLLVVRGSALRALTLSIFGIVHILLVVTGCDCQQGRAKSCAFGQLLAPSFANKSKMPQ